MHQHRFQAKANDIITRAETLHSLSSRPSAFSGPAEYFHLKALGCSFPLELDRLTESCEAVYATLLAWGMHRMGKGGPKMLDFTKFHQSMIPLYPLIVDLQQKAIERLDQKDWDALGTLFMGIEVMGTSTIIVGHSKVLAHYLPNLVGPIDREYTLSYLLGTKQPAELKSRDRQKDLFISILKDFYHAVAANPTYKAMAEQWMTKDSWDSSILKTVDNLVMATQTE